MALDKNFATNITNAVKSLVEADGLLDLSNVIYSATSEIGDFATKHNVITDVRNGKLVPIITLGNNYGALSADFGDCSIDTCDLNASYSTKKWLLGDYNCRVPICLKTYSEDFKLFWGMYNQTLESPLDEADKDAYIAFLTNIAQKNIQGALWRTGYWGDTTATTNELICNWLNHINDYYKTNDELLRKHYKETIQMLKDIPAESLYIWFDKNSYSSRLYYSTKEDLSLKILRKYFKSVYDKN